ncbi:MAG: ATP-dependent DNA helicase RecG [Lachnospiraceae bacterium]|nr:ATP-dependent DNA helicase RecG [Lachnospiraceae bacterium]
MQAEDSILKIKGIGEKTALLYQKLGIHTVGELLRYYPRSYERFEEPVTIRETASMDFAAIRVVIVSVPSVHSVKRLQIVSTAVADEEGSKIRVTWYQMPFLRSTLKPGARYVFRGKIKGTGKSRVLEQPQIFTHGAYEKKQISLQPVYGLTAGLTSQAISKAVGLVFESGIQLEETLPDEVLRDYRLMELGQAVRLMHFPENEQEFRQARRRIAFEEFYRFLIAVSQMKAKLEQEKNHFAITERLEVRNLIERLPYRLTGAQMRTYREISDDLTGHHMMYRMVQGDVGSGKTIVAFLAMYQAALCHYQSALMAPTEVLASQHYKNFVKMAEEYQLPLRIVLLTGSMTAAQKKEAYRQIREHEADLIIGTHALIQEKVQYNDLALVITDEQHRFGVRQRDKLSEKGHTPHVLVMSATPIPRSLAIILYGDLDISVMDELPAARLPIKNCVVDINYRPNAWKFIRGQVEAGRQAYVICPMVEESEQVSGEDVVSYCRKLREAFSGEICVEFLHGKMPDRTKEELMGRFASNEIQVLVSTTVIEVGIDVPNATVIVIENAEKFGLAQLHQLRGRVGRGQWQSYCIMIDTSGKEEARKRLDILNHSNDGFHIASEDLKLRGPGDFFGVRQSGDMTFSVADVYADAAVLKEAAEAAKRFGAAYVN